MFKTLSFTEEEDANDWRVAMGIKMKRSAAARGKNLPERFSFERRKVIGFAITMPYDWLEKLAPHFHPIRSKTKTNRDSLARVFPRFASATCNCYEF